MRRIIIMAVGVLLSLVAVAPASAGSYSKVRHQAHVLHSKVEKRLGAAAAGRDISTDGYRTESGKVRKAHGSELRSFIDTLNRALHPPVVVVAASTSSLGSAPASTSSLGSAAPSSGGYCGAYQFDQQTWNSVGGSGSPCDASPQEQDRRAAMLLASRGTQPWPHCGSTDLAAIRQCENSGSYR